MATNVPGVPSDLDNLKNVPSGAAPTFTPPGSLAGGEFGAGVTATQLPRPVSLQRTALEPTPDQALWFVIRRSAVGLDFAHYSRFIEAIMSAANPAAAGATAGFGSGNIPGGFNAVNAWQAIDARRNSLPFPGVEPYALLKAATEVFVMASVGSLAIVPSLGFGSGSAPGSKGNPFVMSSGAQADPQAFDRFQEYLTAPELVEDWQDYTRNSGVVPYLRVIAQRLGVPFNIQGVPDPAQAALGVTAPDASGIPSLAALGPTYGILQEKLTHPTFLELIWSYWHEEGMLVQTMNAITMRFQNRRMGARDPLANLEIDTLRPLNSFLWGWIQDEQHRLSVMRRAYEYDHHYGFTLHGKAVPAPRTADSRTKFLEAFHNMLFQCMKFYNEDDDTTRIADGFPVLNSVREVHILLTEGGHNQYGDLPWNARMEMLMMEWILARPEMREFIGGRPAVAYTEAWMDRVDTMKTLQGWSDTNIMHFRDLGAFGEQILLSIRFGNWNAIIQPQHAANWARFWRAEIQGYIHAYRAVTGVDLTVVPTDAKSGQVRYLPPSYHLRQRLAEQQRTKMLPR
jgi:hypothetical protein